MAERKPNPLVMRVNRRYKNPRRHAHQPSLILTHLYPFDQSPHLLRVHFWPLASAAEMGSHDGVIPRRHSTRGGFLLRQSLSLLLSAADYNRKHLTNRLSSPSLLRSYVVFSTDAPYLPLSIHLLHEQDVWCQHCSGASTLLVSAFFWSALLWCQHCSGASFALISLVQ